MNWNRISIIGAPGTGKTTLANELSKIYNIPATHKLGLITDEELNKSDVQLIVVDRWNELFKETKYNPIDIHTPLWLWSRNGFKEVK